VGLLTVLAAKPGYKAKALSLYKQPSPVLSALPYPLSGPRRHRTGSPGTARVVARRWRMADDGRTAVLGHGRGLEVRRFPMVADPGLGSPGLLRRVEQLRAQSRALWEQTAELAEAVAQVELEVARVHEGIAAQGGSLAAQAAEHAKRARAFAARERAEAERLRRVGAGWDR
jgi:hypothetical protein